MTGQDSVRIGDAERDAAASALGEHFVAGRLTKAEYDERLETVWKARFAADLQPIFTDLPQSPGAHVNRTARTSHGWDADRRISRRGMAHSRPSHARMHWLTPVMMLGFVGLAAVVLLGLPWLALIAFWLLACGGFGHRGPRRQARTSCG
ncbi:DUF1707 domain-containing protein [Actinobacteria bacterium YIM 96077]|uniref:DUF1707 domain-containing protein n=1 Tax=Phytoactinopolyspora halophila TaxID=1981511 RepID=A0A329QLA3_9ACTN|nr:DUF1707 domain-containing protein [Phytoactinopolyspora halophila]AYY12608.1 DUF1707 domain-containing protein [Actinobacteria bacterium YIM 96077]RAW12489.1 DUF1707 domain-containing protein [Phytoactinopolyspora halophila]